jgi:hypothetical protein
MIGAEHFFARAQYYYAFARDAEDAMAKNAFEVLATESWFKATVLSGQDRLVDGSDVETFERPRTVPLGDSHRRV